MLLVGDAAPFTDVEGCWNGPQLQEKQRQCLHWSESAWFAVLAYAKQRVVYLSHIVAIKVRENSSCPWSGVLYLVAVLADTLAMC